MWPFTRKNNDPPAAVVDDFGPRPDGFMEYAWVRKKMPDPGALSYAFETLDLPLQTVIGPAIAVRYPTKPIQQGAQPYYPRQQVALQGFGTVSGGIVSQPLYNPEYAAFSGLPIPQNNSTVFKNEIQPAGRLTL